jgi:acetate---CoA ligase (ADP-forming)
VTADGKSLKRLLQPRSVAIVGISAEPGSIGAAVLANLTRFQYSGDIHLVSRKQQNIDGRGTVGSIDDLPPAIDAAVLAIPAAAVEQALQSCARRGIGAAVIYASGFAEIGEQGRRAQDELARHARDAGILIDGPNCIGFTNFCDRVPLTYEPVVPVDLAGLPAIGVLAQSGAMASSLRNAFLQKQLGISHVISTGNEASLGVEDFMAFLIEDGRADVIVIFAEQVRHPRKFLESAAVARRKGKPIVMLHPGRSARARASATSHTGALAGDHAVMSALVRHQGIVLVETIEEMIDTAELLARFPEPPDKGVAVMTNSGAFKGLALDYCESIGLRLAQPAPATLAALAAALPSFATVDNPLDVTGQVIKEPAILAHTATPLVGDPEVGSVLVSIVPGSPKQASDKADVLLPVLAKAAKPVAVAVMGDEVLLPPGYSENFRKANVPFFRSPERALRALAHATRYAHRRQLADEPPAKFELPPLALPQSGILTEYAGKAVLSQIGIAVPRGALARDRNEACRIAAEIGYPVVLKAQAAALPHKSDAGGVVLGIASESALKQGWDGLHTSLQAARPKLVLDGVLVEAMAKPGVEFMLGAKRDPEWGAVLMVGLGGIWVEALHDIRLLPIPVSSREIREQIMALRAGALLGPLRGQPPRDVDALVDAAGRVAALMQAFPRIAEIDINPIVVDYAGRGILALDALIALGNG